MSTKLSSRFRFWCSVSRLSAARPAITPTPALVARGGSSGTAGSRAARPAPQARPAALARRAPRARPAAAAAGTTGTAGTGGATGGTGGGTAGAGGATAGTGGGAAGRGGAAAARLARAARRRARAGGAAGARRRGRRHGWRGRRHRLARAAATAGAGGGTAARAAPAPCRPHVNDGPVCGDERGGLCALLRILHRSTWLPAPVPYAAGRMHVGVRPDFGAVTTQGIAARITSATRLGRRRPTNTHCYHAIGRGPLQLANACPSEHEQKKAPRPHRSGAFFISGGLV